MQHFYGVINKLGKSYKESKSAKTHTHKPWDILIKMEVKIRILMSFKIFKITKTKKIA